MNERFFDLLPLTRAAYYHPSQMGTWSIKAVLPALVPEMSYADLDGVQDGGDAQFAWIEAERADSKERQRIAGQLLEYCKLDTLAMVKIVDALLEKCCMGKKKNIKVGSIHPDKIKVRKKSPPPTQVQKSPKDYDRKRLKEEDRKEAGNE